MAIDTRQFEELLKSFTKNIKSVDAAFANLHSNKIKSAFNKAVKEHTGSARDLSQSMKQAAKSMKSEGEYMRSNIKGVNKAFEEYNRGINKVSNGFTKLDEATKGSIRQQAALTSSLLEGIDFSNKAQDKLISNIYDNIKSYKLITKQQNGVISSAWELEKAQSDLAKEVGTFETFLNEEGKNAKKSLDLLRHKAKFDEASLTQGERQLLLLMKKYDLEDKQVGAFKDLVVESKIQIAKLQALAVRETALLKSTEFLHDKFGAFGKVITGSLSPMGSVIEGLLLISSSLKGAWEQFKLVADSGMINNFKNIKAAQLDLGISFEAATKLFSENARLVNVVGGRQFSESLRKGQAGLEKFGIAPEQAAEAIGDFTKAAIKGGINVRDSGKLNRAIQAQTQAFGKLRATTGVNLTEFRAMNEELLNSSSVQEQLNAVNEAERQSKIEDMMKLRQTFVNMGMSAQSAQKALLAIQDIGKQKVTERFDQAAKLQQAAALAGLSNAKQLGDIYLKGKRATAGEQAILQGAMGDMSKVFDQMSMQSFGAENIVNVLTDNLQGPLATMLELGRDQKLGADATGQLTDKMATALSELSKVSDVFAKGLHLEGQFKQWITDPIVRGLGGLGLLLFGIARFMPRLLAGVIGLSKLGVHSLKGKLKTEKAAVQTADAVTSSEQIQHRIENTIKTMAGKEAVGGGGGWDSWKKGGKKGKARWVSQRRGAVAGGASIAQKMSSMGGIAKEAVTIEQAVVNSGGFMSKIGKAFGWIAPIAEKAAGPISKVAGIGSKFLKAIPGIGWFFNALISSVTTIMDMFNAEEVLGMGAGEQASLLQRGIVGVGSFLNSLTFGIFDGAIDNWVKSTANADLESAMLEGWNYILDGFTSIKQNFNLFKEDVKYFGQYLLKLGPKFLDDMKIGLMGIRTSINKGVSNVFGSLLGGIMSVMDSLPDFVKEHLPASFQQSIAEYQQRSQDYSNKQDEMFQATVKQAADQSDGLAEISKARDAEKAKIIAQANDERKSRADELTKSKAEFAEKQKQKQVANAVADQSKQTQQAVVEATNQATDATIDTAKALGMTAWGGLNAASLTGGSTASATVVGKSVNSNLLNTATGGTASSINSEVQTIKLDGESIKALAEQLIALNTTASGTLEVEKQQVSLLEQLVKANSPAQRLEETRVRERQISDPFTSSSKWVSHQKQ